MKAPLTRRSFVGLAAATGGLSAGLVRLGGASRDDGLEARAGEAGRLIEAQVRDGTVAAAALLVRRGDFEFARGYGKARVDTPFLIASPTKPITVSAVTLLNERRQIGLSDPVRKYLPQFSGEGREAVTIRHLLNHTSGLPDMLPENVDLRRRHAPLSEFVARSCTTPLLFRPGAKVGYQSMGILLAAAIVEKVGGLTMPDFLARHIFGPLQMKQSSLGLGGRQIADTALCQVPAEERADWDWNSPYWRNLGAPWGGAHSTVHDLARFLAAFASDAPAPWTPATRREMLEIQTGPHRPSYGLGWVREPGAFGKTCSPATYGHFGSTGTVFWHDPASHTTCVLLTTLPAATSRKTLLVPVSELVGGAG
jgi:CubicO group peptidase (beta-lactamase class C family)